MKLKIGDKLRLDDGSMIVILGICGHVSGCAAYFSYNPIYKTAISWQINGDPLDGSPTIIEMLK